MEVPGNPTGWGNKFPTEAYIDSVKAAGFSTIRIPCAWYSHSNAMSRDSSKADIVPGGGPNEIAASWMDSVQTVVDMCMRAGLVTILNIHWDNGWLEGKLNDADKDAVKARQKDFWTQIATHFKNYNENLLFASANEPATTDENYKHETEILMTYHQTFVDAVRATGGNNESRTLIIQGPSTSVDRSCEVMPVEKLPKDVIENRLMVEVHYYDPYTYTLMNEPADWGAIVQPQYYWGTGDNLATGDDVVHNCGYNAWANAMGDPCTGDRMDDQFGKMKTTFVDKGVPVIIGEFGANDRVGVLTGDKYAKHRKGRLEYYDYLMNSAKKNKVVPIAWDTGHEGENNMTIIRRQSEPDGSIFDMDVLNIMRKAYGLGDYVNTGITHIENFVDGGTEVIAARNGGVTSSFGSVNLRREGTMLYATGNIKLFDTNGNMLRSGSTELSLQGLHQGVYIAKSGNKLLKVNLR
jgi:aryl-phospho-beta-D-glucosidase BglC (GH1 family)